MPLSTDFNISPYFDDYDEAKKFYKILFRPSVAIQARELIQLQSILQNQIERFGNHIFRDGSVVKGCSPTVLKKLDYVRVLDTFNTQNTIPIETLTSDYLLVGQTSNVRAVIMKAVPGVISSYSANLTTGLPDFDGNRLYVKYITTGVNGNTTFANNEQISIYTPSQNKLANLSVSNLYDTINVISTNSTITSHVGQGYGLRIENGIVYHKGFFQMVDDQTIIVRNYDQNTQDYVVGFETTEEIITENADESLFDIALGYSNENAPGAHRLKLTPEIIAKVKTSIASNESFFSLFEFSNVTNDLVINRTKTPYDTLGEIINGRTFDESGDYVTRPFLTEAVPSGVDTTTMAYQISPGKGYVHGSQVEFIASEKVQVDRATTTKQMTNQVITANYGNYIYANQFLGAVDFPNLATVNIYGATISAVSNAHNLAGISLGAAIGTAKIKHVMHDSGDPGLANTVYRVYLSDITMNSGKNFSTDAKAFAATGGTYGNVYGDFVLTNSRAIINDGGKSSLVFPFGKKSLRTLGGTTGSKPDFFFRNSTNSTIATSGNASISAVGTHPAGSLQETINYQTGITLGDAIEQGFLVTLTSNATTVNSSVSVTTATDTITALAGANLQAIFSVGEYVKLFSTTSTIDFRRVTSFTNTSVMKINTNVSVSNVTGANIAKHFPAGYQVPLGDAYSNSSIGNRSIVITGTNSFDVCSGVGNTTLPLTTTANVVVQYPMLRVDSVPCKKIINKSRYVKLNLSTNPGGYNGPWNLGLPDVTKIRYVYANASDYTEDSGSDITKYFSFSDGQKKDYYDHSKLVLKPQYAGALSGKPYVTVVLDHFTPDTSVSVGYFSVDSYPTSNTTPIPDSKIAWAEIPFFDDGKTVYDLRDCIDFRGYKVNTAISSTTLASASINPATTTTFDNNTTSYLLQPDSSFTTDIEYYLGRMDMITINTVGGLGVIKGIASENPKPPKQEVDSMLIATATVPPFPSLTPREATTYGRTDYTVKTRIASNRGYTMKDIGVLDSRIQRLEYYTTLNLLEQKAQNIQVPDANGLNRFKNGLFADPMNSHVYGQSDDIEYLWSIDARYGYGRPLFNAEDIELYWDNVNSTNVQQTGRVLTLPYTNELLIFQPYATKYRNCCQDVWSWNGAVDLYPPYDMHKDIKTLPAVDISIDKTQPYDKFKKKKVKIYGETATSPLVYASLYGDWSTVSSQKDWQYGSQGGDMGVIWMADPRGGPKKYSNTLIVPTTEKVDLGSYVTDVSIQPFIASRTVAFIARNLKPNTRIYAFFDDVAVSSYCAPAALNTTLGANFDAVYAAASATGKLDDVCVRIGNFGDALTTDSYGTLYGMFKIPAETFRTGDRQLLLMDSDNYVAGLDGAITKASAIFTASNISVTSRDVTLTTKTNKCTQPIKKIIRTGFGYIYFYGDPIAQSFTVDVPEDQSGVFLTKIDLFFKSKDVNAGITVGVLGMDGGFPDISTPYGFARLEASAINVSDNASVATTFYFDSPIFLSAKKDYAFYVVPDGNSPEYKMWMAETGGYDVTTGAQIYSNPYTGDAFRSSNAKTWTAIPKEDVKFNIYVANFDLNPATVYFENEDDDFMTFNNLNVVSDTPSVGDFVFLVNSAANATVYNSSVNGIVQGISVEDNILKVDSSTGGFSNNKVIGFFRLPQQGNTSQANSTTLVATANLSLLNNPPTHTIVPRFATMTPIGTSMSFQYRGTSNSAIPVTDTNYIEVSNDSEKELVDYERLVYSKSNEYALGIEKSSKFLITMSTENKYISPVIDLARKSMLALQNLVNNNDADEHTRYGKSITKYVSQPIVLADGQDAEDIRVYISAYRPYHTNVEVYIKFLNAGDSDLLENKAWTKLTNNSPDLYCSPIDTMDWKEYLYTVPTIIDYTSYNPSDATSNTMIGYAGFGGGSYGTLRYYDSSGALYETYKTFAVKVVLLSENGIWVPKLNDVRAIALQV